METTKNGLHKQVKEKLDSSTTSKKGRKEFRLRNKQCKWSHQQDRPLSLLFYDQEKEEQQKVTGKGKTVVLLSHHRSVNKKLLHRTRLTTELSTGSSGCTDIHLDPIYGNIILTGSMNGYVGWAILHLSSFFLLSVFFSYSVFIPWMKTKRVS